MKAYKIILLGLIFFSSINSISQETPTFTEHPIDDTFIGVSSLSVEDIDNDGLPDVIGGSEYAQGAGAKGVSWWKNNGDGSWSRNIINETFQNIMSLQTVDINNDGNSDVLISDWSAHQIVYWTSNGNDPPNWTETIVASNFYNAHDAFAIDIDDNGFKDIIGVAAYNGHVKIWYQSAEGSWTPQIIDNTLAGGRAVFVIDIDDDEDIDIIAGAMGTGHKLSLYTNEGGAQIQWATQIIDNTSGSHHIYSFDFDSDNDQDILVSEPENGEIFWWKNDGGNPIVWEKEPIANLESVVRTLPADFDNDGDFDILGAGKFSNELSIWYNEGGSPFNWTKETVNNQLNYFWPTFIVDMDGDTDLDFVAGAGGDGVISWWENELITTGISNNKTKPEIKFFPNPSHKNITIEGIDFFQEPVLIEIINSVGKIVFTQLEQNPNLNKNLSIDVSNLVVGIYIIRVKGRNDTASRKLIINHN